MKEEDKATFNGSYEAAKMKRKGDDQVEYRGNKRKSQS